jgi:hypothetical protein
MQHISDSRTHQAPVELIFVFRKTCPTHREPCHGRARTVVRNIANDGEARAAVCAINKRITIAPVIRVEQLALTIRTNRNVWRNQRAYFFSLVAMNNAEVLIAITRQVMDGEARNPRQRRRFDGQVLNEILNSFCRPLYFDGYSSRCIVNRAFKVPTDGDTIDVRAEPDSLHDA